MKNIGMILITASLGALSCLSTLAFAQKTTNPPTYEKCIGKINSAPIPELEEACAAARVIAEVNRKELSDKIANKTKAGESNGDYENNQLNQLMMIVASANIHSAVWEYTRTGLITDNVCKWATLAANLFNRSSINPGYKDELYFPKQEAQQLRKACENSFKNSNLDSLWGLSIVSMKELVVFYNRDTKNRLTTYRFATFKFKRPWRKSTISNGYEPLRTELNARYKLAESGLTEAEFTTIRIIYFQGMERLDSQKRDSIPNFIYNWMKPKPD